MATRIPLVITFLLSLHLSATAQELNKQEFDAKYQTYSYVPATGLFWRYVREYKPKKFRRKWQKLDTLDRNDFAVKLGNAYYFNAEYEDAKVIYEKVDSTDVELGLEYFFRYALSLRSLGKYDSSKIVFKSFNNRAAAMGAREYTFKPLKDIIKNSDRYTTTRADFNSPCEFESNYNCSDFAPIFYKDGLVFASNRKAGVWKRYRHTWNAQNFHDLYYIEDIESKDASNLGVINSIFHESSSAITKDGRYMYFTRSNVSEEEKKKLEKDLNGYIRLELFRAEWSDDKKTWVEPEELPFNNDSYSVAHPALSPDGKTLYFASDMPGTYGESDLYKVSITNDTIYGRPKNLGYKINTPARETFPFISEDNILYFSSDWHQGLGGLDIFATSIKEENYKRQVINIGRPVNSQYDDFSFIINDITRKGYFASNRPFEDRENIDDIYIFEETQPLVFE